MIVKLPESLAVVGVTWCHSVLGSQLCVTSNSNTPEASQMSAVPPPSVWDMTFPQRNDFALAVVTPSRVAGRAGHSALTSGWLALSHISSRVCFVPGSFNALYVRAFAVFNQAARPRSAGSTASKPWDYLALHTQSVLITHPRCPVWHNN